MKTYILTCFAIGAMIAGIFTACSEDNSPDETPGTIPVRLKPSVTQTRAVNYPADVYFHVDGKANVSLDTSTSTYMYDAASGMLLPADSGEELFFESGTQANIAVEWPADRSNRAIPTDQSDRETFLKTDWMRVELKNVTPVYMLPVTLEHERSKITFTLGGDLYSTQITGLTIAGYQACCIETDAQLILDPVQNANTLKDGPDGEFTTPGGGTYQFKLSRIPVLTAGGNHTIVIGY